MTQKTQRTLLILGTMTLLGGFALAGMMTIERHPVVARGPAAALPSAAGNTVPAAVASPGERLPADDESINSLGNLAIGS
jgi:hypothetical protein